MANIKDNTVSAVNQMINSSLVYFLGNPNAKTKILIVGNSITRHGPKADIGWHGDWGMAASAPEKDYVHRLFDMLNENGQDVLIRVSQCANWERGFREQDVLSNFQEDRAFSADIVIFRLGENVLAEDAPYIQEELIKFADYLCPNGKVIFTTCFWKNEVVDNAITAVATMRNDVCIDGCFSNNEKNMALGEFEHAGVAMHPSDAGMEEIAKAIFSAIKI